MINRDPWVLAVFAIFAIHGACFFRVRYLLRKAGLPVKAISTGKTLLSEYRAYWREAPTMGWSRSLIYASILSLVSAIVILLVWMQKQPHQPFSSDYSDQSSAQTDR